MSATKFTKGPLVQAAMPELYAAAERALASFEGCECLCVPAHTDKYGFYSERYTCIPCHLRAESAPKDGTRILALWPKGKTLCAFETFWDADESQGDKPGWSAPGWNYMLDGLCPTHWQPLPPAPCEPSR